MGSVGRLFNEGKKELVFIETSRFGGLMANQNISYIKISYTDFIDKKVVLLFT